MTSCRYLIISKRLICQHLGNYDVLVVGGGIVGVSAAREIATRTNFSVGLVEKECALAKHQSGHNSGVVHAGIYYKPGSQRAQLCTEGMKLAYDYFSKNDVPYKKVGKLIVATHEREVDALMDLYDRGQKNGVPDMSLLDSSDIKKFEPHCCGVKAIHSPQTGIVDWGLVCDEFYAKDFVKAGGKIHLSFKVSAIKNSSESTAETDITKYPVEVKSASGDTVSCGYLLCCAGLYADRVASLSGGSKIPPVVPVRGEYLVLRPEKSSLVKGNIYPVPDPRMPFLGVHFTPRMNGAIWLGPNAVLAMAREGYTYFNVNPADMWDSLSYKGVRKLAIQYYDFGADQFLKSLFIRLALKDLQRYIPEITINDIARGPSGVRAQCIGENGNLIEDFIFDTGSDKDNKSAQKNRVLHCRNAPSPGATSALAIARVLHDKMMSLME